MLIPGKILVIENNWDDVKEVVESLWQAGDGIVYLSGVPEEDRCPANVRLVILDLVLQGDGEVQDTDYQQAALAIHRLQRRTGFFLILPWSVHITPENRHDVVDRLRAAYKEQAGKELPQRMLKAFGKKEIEKEQVASEIERWIRRNPEAGLVFEWEKGIEEGRDKTVSQLIEVGGLRTIARALQKEAGKVSAARQMFALFTKLLTRHAYSLLREERTKPLFARVLRKEGPQEKDVLDWYPRVRSLETFHDIERRETLWTGDILETDTPDPERKYAVVLTPACEFAQRKVDRVALTYGMRIDAVGDFQVNAGAVPLVVEKMGRTKERKWRSRKDVVNALLTGTGLQSRYYVLHFLRESHEAKEQYFHLLVDFCMVGSRKVARSGDSMNVPTGWKRICRLDSPYIEDLLQKYASFCARIGKPELPEAVITKEGQRLQS